MVSAAGGDYGLAQLAVPLPLDDLADGAGGGVADRVDGADRAGRVGGADRLWEVEIGFGKGRFLLRRCLEHPERRFLGIEQVAEYHRLFVSRARRRGARNWVALRGEALYLLASALPRGFAAAVHVYFPDPWPKSRHHKRRLFDPETVDLVTGLLAPGGRLYFATDFLEYGELVRELLAAYPGLAVGRRAAPWDDGPRTNYEAKYVAMGRPILRLEASLATPPLALHPSGRAAVLAATATTATAAAATAATAEGAAAGPEAGAGKPGMAGCRQ